MEQNFPITLHRLKASESGQAIIQNLSDQGLALWQIEQAVCNLVVSREISPDDLHYGKISGRKLQEKIIDIVRGRFELADASDDFAWMTQELVATQIELDSISLLLGIGIQRHKIPTSGLQGALKKEGLLEEDAFVDP